jgi:hypothetical protein
MLRQDVAQEHADHRARERADENDNADHTGIHNGASGLSSISDITKSAPPMQDAVEFAGELDVYFNLGTLAKDASLWVPKPALCIAAPSTSVFQGCDTTKTRLLPIIDAL